MFNKQDLINAQRLAYFLVSCPRSYLLIVSDAAERAMTQSRRQEDHFAEPPQNRPVCVNWKPKHLLQLWVCETAKQYESAPSVREINDEAVDDRDLTLIIRFIRDVVTWRMVELNTFHATVGLTEILYGYDRSIEDLPEYYRIRLELDPEDEKKALSYFRRCYGALLKYLASPKRFEGLIKVEKEGTKNRIHARSNSQDFGPIISGTLRDFFTLWETSHPDEDALEKSYYYGNSISQHSTAEAIRAHRLLCPDCFFKIISSLNLCDPLERLRIPQFAVSESSYKGPPAGRRISDEESSNALPLLVSSLEAKVKGRAQYVPGLVWVQADGRTVATWDLVNSGKRKIKISQDRRLIEISTTQNLLLATHFIPYDEMNGIFQIGSWAVNLPEGQQFIFTISDNHLNDTSIVVEYKETKLRRAATLAYKRAKIKIEEAQEIARNFAESLQKQWRDLDWQELSKSSEHSEFRWEKSILLSGEGVDVEINDEEIKKTIALYEDQNQVVTSRCSAIRSLERASPDNKEAVAALLKALRDKDEEIRVSAVMALGIMKPKTEETISSLRLALEDESIMVRELVKIVLRLYGDDI